MAFVRLVPSFVMAGQLEGCTVFLQWAFSVSVTAWSMDDIVYQCMQFQNFIIYNHGSNSMTGCVKQTFCL